jgi:hypothetical protein
MPIAVLDAFLYLGELSEGSEVATATLTEFTRQFTATEGFVEIFETCENDEVSEPVSALVENFPCLVGL